MFLNIFLDVILVAILIGVSSYGYKKGLFKMTAGPSKLILCVVISLTYSSAFGNLCISPIIFDIAGETFSPYEDYIINPLAVAISFGILFLLSKIIISFVISMVNNILEKGILGSINKGLGVIFAGAVAFLTAVCLVSLSEYLLVQGGFAELEYFSEFSGGPLYRFFNLISPSRLIFTN